jgi:hypothetical protein
MTESTLPPEDEPDALADTDVDDVRAEEVEEDGAAEDPYQLRSMPAEPNPTEDDPGSYINP